MGLFCADVGMIGLSDTEWLQGDINVHIGLFRRVGLMANIEKSNTMNFQSGGFRMGVSEEAFSCRSKVGGITYWESLRQRIPCPNSGVDLTAGSMTAIADNCMGRSHQLNGIYYHSDRQKLFH